ncbi:hypothetical protein REPUB_Repub18cG0056500 [Reevesia pubescens]
MAEDLESFWNKLTLTESEMTEISIDQDWVEKNGNVCKLSLVGKLFSRKITNIAAMQSVLSQVWKVRFGLQIKEVGDKVYMFSFGNIHEKDHVLMMQPWSFNKALLILEEVDNMTRPD